MSATEVVLYDETPSGVATITINRPKSMNSLSGEVFTKLNEIAKKLRYSKTAKVVVLTGAGNRAFSAGNDVKGGSFTAGAEYDARLQVDTIEALDALPQPLICAVNGVCYTGALELLMPADIIVATKNSSVFCDTHARLGLVPTWGLSVRLPRKIGLSNAKIMSFTGRKFNGDDAQKIGLVDMLFDDDKLMNETFKLAEEMAVNSFDSIRKQKKMMDYGFMSSQREALAWTDEVNGFHPGFAKDMKERMNTLFGAGKNKKKSNL